MPIELTRRDVVKAGLVTAAGTIPHLTGCATRSEAPGPVHDPEIDRVLVLSDTHIAADPGTLSRGGVNMSDRLNQVVERTLQQDRRWIWSPPGRPMADWMEEAPEFKGWRLRHDFAFGLINGDAAYDIGVEGDYRTLQAGLENLDGLRFTTHVLLGNHDNRVNFRHIYRGHRHVQSATALGGKHVAKIGVDRSRYCDWLLLDSLRVTDEVPGELKTKQLAWIDASLGEDPKRPAIIAVHHPPVPDDDPDRPFALQDHEAFWEVVAHHPNVKAVLHGHTHRWEPRKWSLGDREVDLIGLPPTSYVFDEANPWGYVVADVDAAGVRFTLRAMDGHAADGESVRIAFG